MDSTSPSPEHSVPSDEVVTEHIDQGVLITSPSSVELTPKITVEDIEIPTGSMPAQRNKIIMTYLPSEISEKDLRKLCESKGELLSFRLIVDPVTRERRGYSFAEYRHAADAVRACNELNGLLVLDKRIKVCLARPQDAAIRNANLHISQFPKTWTILDLYNYFRYLGHVIACKILTDPVTRASKGIAFVRFATHKEADDVRSQLNGMVPIGEAEPFIITYAHANGPNSVKRNPQGPEPDSTTSSIPTSSMMHLTLTNAATSPNSDASSSTRSPTTSESSSLGGQPSTSGQSASAVPKVPRPQRRYHQSWPLFVGNLGRAHNETFLKMVFEQYGAIESVKIMKVGGDDGGGYGFVNMWNPDEAFMAVQHLHGFKIAENHFWTVTIKPLSYRPPAA